MSLSDLKEKFSELEIHFLYATNCIILDKLVVPKDKRNHGLGSLVMKELVELADEAGWIVMLTPSDSLGATSVSRLKKFYKRFGFEMNQGKSKQFELPNYSMFRNPNCCE